VGHHGLVVNEGGGSVQQIHFADFYSTIE
jgi:hypothetical protein